MRFDISDDLGKNDGTEGGRYKFRIWQADIFSLRGDNGGLDILVECDSKEMEGLRKRLAQISKYP